MSVIIRSGKRNWSGKEFSDLPAKIYGNFDDAVNALNSYHFYEYDEVEGGYIPKVKMQKLEIIHLTGKKKRRLLSEGVVRY